ncbi:hypothetical protein GCK32_011257 [Trichostrongylus colubriformis]|uniref:Uncharacterized protein n=1 Tax=Trichostrongylus colubriformis TaxID=6319 RepID=A0AAN8EV88_TRICO
MFKFSFSQRLELNFMSSLCVRRILSKLALRGFTPDAAARVPHAVLVAAPDAAPVAVHAADVVSTYSERITPKNLKSKRYLGCGCCGCGGGGRKRRSLDNLRIRLEAKKSAEQSGAKLPIDEYPRQKRDIMCQNECASQPGCHFGHEHDIYGDY